MGLSPRSLAALWICAFQVDLTVALPSHTKGATLLLQVTGGSGQTDQMHNPTADAPDPSKAIPRPPQYQDKFIGWSLVIATAIELMVEYHDRLFVRSSCKEWQDFAKATQSGNWSSFTNLRIIGSHIAKALFFWGTGVAYLTTQDGFPFSNAVHILGQQVSTVGFGDSEEVPHTEAFRSRLFGMLSILSSRMMAFESALRPWILGGPAAIGVGFFVGFVLLLIDRAQELKADPWRTLLQVLYLFTNAVSSVGLGDITPEHEWAKIVLGMLYPMMTWGYDQLVTYVNKGPRRVEYEAFEDFAQHCPEDEPPAGPYSEDTHEVH